MSLVTDTPSAFDFFTLDGERSPGICKIVSGGGRKIKIEDQGQLLTIGANTVVRRVENITITYGFKLWLPGHFQTVDRWRAMLEAGGKRSSPRVYTLVDLRAPLLSRVVYEAEEPVSPEKPGGPWDWKLTLHEWNRVKPYGGPVKAPQTEVEKAIADVNKQNQALQQQLDALGKAKK